MVGAFVLKVIVGLAFLNFHFEYRGPGQTTGDSELFIYESQILTNVFYESPIDYFKFLFGLESPAMVEHYLSETTYWAGDPSAILNDSMNILKIHSIFNFYSFSYPPINLISCTFFSVFGVYHLFNAFKKWVVIDNRLLFLALLLLPSVLFWTSGVLKESFLFLGIGLFVGGIIGSDSGLKRTFFVLFGSLFLIGFKPYVFIFIIVAIGVFQFLKLFKNRILAVSVYLAILLIGTVVFYSMKENKITSVISNKQFDFIGISKGSNYFRNDSCFFNLKPEQLRYIKLDSNGYYLTKPILVEYHFPYQKVAPNKVMAMPNTEPWEVTFRVQQCGSYIPLTYINDSPKQLVKNVPDALINVLFRPYFSDPGGKASCLAVIEVFLLYIFLGFSFLKARKLDNYTFYLVISLVTFIILLSLLIGWVTPALGAIVRYRFPVYLAILLIGLLILKPISFLKPRT